MGENPRQWKTGRHRWSQRRLQKLTDWRMRDCLQSWNSPHYLPSLLVVRPARGKVKWSVAVSRNTAAETGGNRRRRATGAPVAVLEARPEEEDDRIENSVDDAAGNPFTW